MCEDGKYVAGEMQAKIKHMFEDSKFVVREMQATIKQTVQKKS